MSEKLKLFQTVKLDDGPIEPSGIVKVTVPNALQSNAQYQHPVLLPDCESIPNIPARVINGVAPDGALRALEALLETSPLPNTVGVSPVAKS